MLFGFSCCTLGISSRIELWWRDFEAYALKNKFYGVVRGQNSEKPLELGFQADATYPQCVMWLISLAVFFFFLI